MRSNSDISIKESKNKFLIPHYLDKPIHSMVNPQKEAESLANNYMSQLTKNPITIILGLGFGYHVDEIYKFMKLRHENPQIIIIEALPELIKIFESYKGFKNHNPFILSTEKAADLFFNETIVKALLAKPTIIIHPGSFNVSPEYYRQFLTKRSINSNGPEQYKNAIDKVIAQYNLPPTHGNKLVSSFLEGR